MQMGHYLPRGLPEALHGLASLALDLRWSWNHGADDLWQAVDPDLWRATANPWLILESVSDRRLDELTHDQTFLQALQRQLAAREEHFQAEAWFTSRYGATFSGQIAYFSMEFGLSESLPIYSGGLGVLAGDYLKTACDLDVPLVGIGLLYQQGYFRQALDAQGGQIEFYPYNDPTMLPVVPLRGDDGEWVHVRIELPGRTLSLRSWRAQVGRRTLLLLDSNTLLNGPGDRGITSELYGGGPELRLQQEMVLGIGGWRLLEQLGIDCPVCHLNEGHAALAILERARHFMRCTGESFRVALCATRAGNLFTTHTPVVAGFDRFPPRLFARYFQDYAAELGVPMEELLALGRCHAGDAGEAFNMAYLAVRGAAAVNGVSRLHGEVSRGILQSLFPRWPRHEVPVGHVSNGVHMPSWDSAAADALWTRACGKARWRGTLQKLEAALRQIEDEALWRFRMEGRQRLIVFLKERLVRQLRVRGASGEQAGEGAEVLEPDVLTLGFARRFAEYKRTNLLLQDPERLLRLLGHRDRPVQLVIAGKAHPQDREGKRLLRQWQDFFGRPELRGRVAFVEDYDLVVAGQLVQGVDVWINTPRRPWEASGTSGMKVLVNGGINLSELDGWWAEAYTPEVGWALGDSREHNDVAGWDRAEAEQLYQLLEQEVIPCFYRRDESGVPREWVGRMRESMVQLTMQYSSNRMLREYVEMHYIPLAEAYRRRTVKVANELHQWYGQLQQHWARMHFGNVVSNRTGSGYYFEVQVYLDDMPPQAVAVELYADSAPGRQPVKQALQRGEPLAVTATAYIYRGSVPADRPVEAYTARVVPLHAEAWVPLEANFILWHR
ncbi:alpha-glucan family phosphorylase [Sedimenticola hydrogenitrophicus]|uniref:alpha-glucan family phosphorylase n=1 Tax=Sedimenticola hydrogenitrophicus TaxID=2967975 RepID=UPI0021A3880B|nr:alpha-glucan family phosphorylase [Sedimenticola hydrogenitrophicus]